MVTKKSKKLLLVDGSSYLFRAYHALPPLTNSKDVPTGAIYGVVNMLKKLIADESPEYIAVVFDTKGKNFRHELYSEYKANRPEMPEELALQIKPLHQIIEAMGLPLIAISGVEADDVIGTLCHKGIKEGLQVTISTGDKDMAQLVTKDVILVNTMSGTTMDEAGVQEKFGVRPDQIIDYLALIGDSVDNVPGVPKVGPKTAQKWLTQYETLDAIIEQAEAIKGKVGENLREHLDFLPLGKALVTIKTDIDVPVTTSDLTPKESDQEALQALFKTLEFQSWLKEVSADSQPANVALKQYETVLTMEAFDQWLDKIKQKKCVAIDTETTSINPHMADLVGISLSVMEHEACYIPLQHCYEGCPKQLDKTRVLKKLAPLLADPSITKVGQHLKYDMHVLHKEGIEVYPPSHDTMVASYCLHATQTRHDMDSLARFYLNHQTISYESVAGKGAKQITFDYVPLEEAAPYAAEDADITLRLHHFFNDKLLQDQKLYDLYQQIEMPLVAILYNMEQVGVLIDEKQLHQQSKAISERLADIEKQAVVLADEPFNLASPKQLQHILYEKFKLPITHKTPKGAPSTSEEALQELAHEYELPKLILEHRSLSKLKSTYTDKLPQLINPKTGRIHTSYHQAVTATGRLSSSDPNLQNIPIRTEEGRKIRKAFIAKPNYVLLSADYSQIELRIMAHLSQDKQLLKAFHDNQDIHQFTASEVFGVSLDKVTAEQRRSAKAINFGLIYGMSAFGLARQLGIEQANAREYMAQYFNRYPKVKAYMEDIKEIARKKGYVETIKGRRLYLPDINTKNVMRRKQAERIAINAPLQGTAADIIKLAMIQVHKQIHGREDIDLLMQVHDELIFEVHEKVIEEAIQVIKSSMETTTTLTVPLVAEVGYGSNWDEAH